MHYQGNVFIRTETKLASTMVCIGNKSIDNSGRATDREDRKLLDIDKLNIQK